MAIAALGLGNGIALVSENVLLQQVIPMAGAVGGTLGARALYAVAAVGWVLAYLNARTRLAGEQRPRRCPHRRQRPARSIARAWRSSADLRS